MKILALGLFSLLAMISCSDNKAKEPIFDTFDIYASKSDKIVVDYYENKLITDKTIRRTITKHSEITNLRTLIKQSSKTEGCYYSSGTINFYKDSEGCGSLEFGLDQKCSSFYIYFEGKPTTYKMSPECEAFLSALKNNNSF